MPRAAWSLACLPAWPSLNSNLAGNAAREAHRARGQAIGRPKVLDASKVALAQRMHASGESTSTIAATRGVSRATVYRVLAENAD
jgi:DNA invertase Pin-like site-specific DNA recombinase